MPLPTFKINLTSTFTGIPVSGSLIKNYKPFYNLNSDSGLTDLQLPLKTANLEYKTLDIIAEPSYDESVNLIITDRTNTPKLINSRFRLTSSLTYEVADREGNVDTNIYSLSNFDSETRLIKSVNNIITLDFLGIFNGGKLPVGNYNFYFKLADSDGNETDFISESGQVVCYIGEINKPTKIRGGQLNESSEKLVKFKLNNLDLAYSYINVYYSRATGNESNELVTYYKIEDKFKISGDSTSVIITGYEKHVEIDAAEINLQYSYFDSVNTIETCQNMTFAGNITNDYSLFEELKDLSLRVTPKLIQTKNIGNLNHLYNETSSSTGYEYFNPDNIYYSLGYWNDEIYRFGIVYILNDYTLSPVFDIRGIKELTTSGITFTDSDDYVKYSSDSSLEGYSEQNNKGVFKVSLNTSTNKVFNGENSIKPIGISFSFSDIALNGSTLRDGLKSLTKGFFIVRQKRIPSILAQGIGIATSEKAYFPVIKTNNFTNTGSYIAESFLTSVSSKPKLKSSYFQVNSVKNNALLCPEANLKKYIYNNFFNSSEYKLRNANIINSDGLFKRSSAYNRHFYMTNFTSSAINTETTSKLSLIESGINLTTDGNNYFSSKAGDQAVAWKHSDPVYGDVEDVDNTSTNDNKVWSNSTSKVRGEFNSYIGCSNSAIDFGQIYNIYQNSYSFTDYWQDYFKIRYNDSSSYFPVSDRISWDDYSESVNCYRGDCYICTVTQRLHWNFVDSDMPTNKKIIDPWNWFKNYKVAKKSSTVISDTVTNDDGSTTITTEELVYRKVLPMFTYKKTFVLGFYNEPSTGDGSWEPPGNTILEPDAKKFKKYSEINGTFGFEKINKPDVNAVPIGTWVTYKICANSNLALRDNDFTRPAEEAIHKQKRSFYPYSALNPQNNLPESDVINLGISKTIGSKYYYRVPDVPYIKTNFSNRIHYSNINLSTTFKNANRIYESNNYQDYTLEYGALVKLVEWYGSLIAVMEHGVLMIPVNERAMMANASGDNIYINTDTVLPKNPKIISNMYGSTWMHSIIKTARFIYGIDTVGKKIWRTNGQTFELISDLKIQKFLNDNIHLYESDKSESIGGNCIKTHFNAFKQDVMFVFNYDSYKWNLCWNEVLSKWTTQYTWFPEFSENINNIFYTFANKSLHSDAGNKLYKHGFAGNEEELGVIYPTKWYTEQFPFELEFVVNGLQGIQKIFDNFKIISNLTEPKSFYYEVVGEGFDWNSYKDVIINLNNLVNKEAMTDDQIEAAVTANYLTYLTDNPSVKKLPFIICQSTDVNNIHSFFNTKSVLKDLTLHQHNKTKENLVLSYQLGANIKNSNYGRLKGNMQYLEDSWNIQIQPISFKYAYLSSGQLKFTNNVDMKIRDKYLKIRIKYNGDKYAIINAINTSYTLSYA